MKKVCKNPDEVSKAPSNPGAAKEKVPKKGRKATGLSRKSKVQASAAKMLRSTGKQKLGVRLW